MSPRHAVIALTCILPLAACTATPPRPASSTRAPATGYDLLIRNGTVYDGSGGPPRALDVAVRGDRIAALLESGTSATATHTFDADGQAVAPGFINMLSWANESLLHDGRGMSDTMQGVTLEIFGEGSSMGPLLPALKQRYQRDQGDIKYPVAWDTLGGYLDHLVQRGVTPNVASFVGATTVRLNVIGDAPRRATPQEIARMQAMVREAMREGALGVGASLIYEPASNADTAELTALAKAAGEHGGGYIAHLRNEGGGLLQALDELIAIGHAANVHAEVYHLKAAGVGNWPQMASAIARIETARAAGQSVSANMYTYAASATGLDTQLPKWVREGGAAARQRRLRDPALRARIIAGVEGVVGGSPLARELKGRTVLTDFRSPALKPLTGKTLAEIAALRGTGLARTIVELLAEDGSRIGAVFFGLSEDNVRLGLRQPWVSIGSDATSEAPEGVFLQSGTHPRAYGNVARLLGHYVREERLLTLPDAVHRLTGLPARHWKLKDRGCLQAGCYADIVVFDPATIRDNATFTQPAQYASGVSHVWVNGVQVLRGGLHTGAKPGQVVRGPGWSPSP